MLTLDSVQLIEDFTRGCFFQPEVSGDPLFGQKMLREALDAGKRLHIVDAKELAGDTWTICPYLMGPAPGPETEEIIQARKNHGLTQELVSNMPAAAAQLLLDDAQVKLGAVISL
jgi:DUF917 family protein